MSAFATEARIGMSAEPDRRPSGNPRSAGFRGRIFINSGFDRDRDVTWIGSLNFWCICGPSCGAAREIRLAKPRAHRSDTTQGLL